MGDRSSLSPLEGELSPDEFRRNLRLLMADRASPEAAALFETLLRYVYRRVGSVSRHCGSQLTQSRQEEVAAEVLLQLMQGSLARFRGGSIGELYGFVRTIADRCAWRAIRAVEKERKVMAGMEPDAMEAWTAIPDAPDKHAEVIPDSPLSANDQSYLRDLIQAGSKAELARRAGVSRAAVTQRVQRIRSRISELAPGERMAHDVWLRHEARIALDQ